MVQKRQNGNVMSLHHIGNHIVHPILALQFDDSRVQRKSLFRPTDNHSLEPIVVIPEDRVLQHFGLLECNVEAIPDQ